MKRGTLKIAPPYDDELVNIISEGFRDLLGQPVEFDVVEDENLIGGFLVIVDGVIYDAGLKQQLERTRGKLKES